MSYTKTFTWPDFGGVDVYMPFAIIFKKEIAGPETNLITFTVEYNITITDETIADVFNADPEMAEGMWTGEKFIRITKNDDNPLEYEAELEGMLPFCLQCGFGGLFNGVIQSMRDSEEERVSDEEETISIEDVEIFAQIGQL